MFFTKNFLSLYVILIIFHFSAGSNLFNSSLSDQEFFPKLCNSNKIPTIKVAGRNGNEIKLAFAGDTHFGRNIEKQIEKDSNSYSVLYSEIKDILNQNDAFSFNLKSVVTEKVKQLNDLPEKWNLISKPISLHQAFADLNTTIIANLANNHQYDANVYGFTQTIKNCYCVSKFFASKENAVPDSYEFPKDFPQNIHNATEEHLKSVPPLPDLIDSSALILDVDGVKIGMTGVSIDFEKFLMNQKTDQYYQEHKKTSKKYGCSLDLAVTNYQKFLMLTNNNRYNNFKKVPSKNLTKSLINYWTRRVLIDLKRQGAQVFIVQFNGMNEYMYTSKCFGPNFNSSDCQPTNNYIQELQSLGVDAIITSGAHVIFPFKKYQNPDTLVEFSLGNSVFDLEPSPKTILIDIHNDMMARTWTGIIQELIIDKETLKIKRTNIIPTICAPYTNYKVLLFPAVENNTQFEIQNAAWKFDTPLQNHNYIQFSYNLTSPMSNFKDFKNYLDGFIDKNQLEHQNNRMKVFKYVQDLNEHYDVIKKNQIIAEKIRDLNVFEDKLVKQNIKGKQNY